MALLDWLRMNLCWVWRTTLHLGSCFLGETWDGLHVEHQPDRCCPLHRNISIWQHFLCLGVVNLVLSSDIWRICHVCETYLQSFPLLFNIHACSEQWTVKHSAVGINIFLTNRAKDDGLFLFIYSNTVQYIFIELNQIAVFICSVISWHAGDTDENSLQVVGWVWFPVISSIMSLPLLLTDTDTHTELCCFGDLWNWRRMKMNSVWVHHLMN